MNGSERKDSILDAMAVISFFVGMANYEENITQSQLQEVAKGIMSDIHMHLKEQDNKIDRIIELLEKEDAQNGHGI